MCDWGSLREQWGWGWDWKGRLILWLPMVGAWLFPAAGGEMWLIPEQGNFPCLLKDFFLVLLWCEGYQEPEWRLPPSCVHVVTCTGTHPLPGGIQYSNNLEVVAKEAGVTCSHVRMRNELGRHGWLLAGTCHFQIEWLFPCMEISDVGAKMLRMLR